MVSKELIMGTIKKMFSSGVDDETVRNTLKDIGLSDSEVSAYIAEAKGTRPAQSSTQRVIQEEAPRQSEEEESDELGSDEADAGTDEAEEGEIGGEGFDEEEVSSGMEDRVRGDIQGVRDVHEMGHTATHAALEDHSEMLEELQRKLDRISSKLDMAPSISPETVKKINALDSKITLIEKELLEVKALTTALQDILKKVLDTDREVLNRLEKN